MAASAALVLFARWLLALIIDVRYWHPDDPDDYAAIALTSAGLFLLAATLWLLRAADDLATDQTRRGVWRWSLAVGAFAAVVAGLGNLAEDWMRVQWAGWAFIIGSLTLVVALFPAAIVRLSAPGPRRVGYPLVLIGIILGVFAGFLGSGLRSNACDDFGA
ncbi:hypothetical protein [Sinomonas gamaensis]|uniref:hypothetical protein n=1 Tax=Sinomonas gamaensis TaxID=2565624 RepID=UPI001107AB3B|nr:hypothetical protein [Sinomonas gamaensis]